jgi:hypothetical protein
MAAVNIMNNQLAFWALTLVDPTTGATVPVPATDVFTPVSSAPNSLGVSYGADPGGSGAMGIIATPLVLESDSGNSGGGFSITITDSNGDLADTIPGPINITTVPVVEQITTASVPTFSANPTLPTNPGP